MDILFSSTVFAAAATRLGAVGPPGPIVAWRGVLGTIAQKAVARFFKAAIRIVSCFSRTVFSVSVTTSAVAWPPFAPDAPDVNRARLRFIQVASKIVIIRSRTGFNTTFPTSLAAGTPIGPGCAGGSAGKGDRGAGDSIARFPFARTTPRTGSITTFPTSLAAGCKASHAYVWGTNLRDRCPFVEYLNGKVGGKQNDT